MGDFAKLDFSIAFNPTSAFPIDARCYFTSLALAEQAAATAEETGSPNTKYYYGMKLLVDDGAGVHWYTIQRDRTLRKDVLFIALTQSDYDAMVEAGTVIDDVPYLIVRDNSK
jgi:hypothetical protein